MKDYANSKKKYIFFFTQKSPELMFSNIVEKKCMFIYLFYLVKCVKSLL